MRQIGRRGLGCACLGRCLVGFMGILVQVRYSEGGQGLGGFGSDLVEPVLAVEVVICWF